MHGSHGHETRSQLASLAIGGSADARKFVIRLMDMLFDQRTLAGMSAVGSRQADNLDILQRLCQLKFEMQFKVFIESAT